jgi:hypothetical protein
MLKNILGKKAFQRKDYELACTLYGRGIQFVQPTRMEATRLSLETYVRVATNLAVSFAKTNRSV